MPYLLNSMTFDPKERIPLDELSMLAADRPNLITIIHGELLKDDPHSPGLWSSVRKTKQDLKVARRWRDSWSGTIGNLTMYSFPIDEPDFRPPPLKPKSPVSRSKAKRKSQKSFTHALVEVLKQADPIHAHLL